MEENPPPERLTSGARDAASDPLRNRIVASLPRYRRFARALTRDMADADDLVQTAIERALQRVGQWRADSSLEAWMFGIIRNAWIDEIRSRRRRTELFAPEEAGASIGDASAESHAIMLSVQDAMARLPADQRTAVALVLIEGLSYKEAASVMDVPIGTLTSRLARGRDALQAMLGD